MSLLLNDGSSSPPSLKVYLNLGTLDGLPEKSLWPGLSGAARDEHLIADGFEGIQLVNDESAELHGLLPYCGVGRINHPSEAAALASRHRDRGDLCVTLHAGWGLEDDDEVSRLVEAMLAAADKHNIPLFLETHRATITQDLWRTLQIVKRFPEVRFNGDFSHYYCGQELVYGEWATKLMALEPIFFRTAFLHGRIASPGCMQVPIDRDLATTPRQAHGAVNYLGHFRELWTLAMMGFLRMACPGDILIFAPELLSGTHYYARLFPDASGELIEETDRYAQALIYKELAQSCFLEAQRRFASAEVISQRD